MSTTGRQPARVLRGIPVSPGIALGQAVVIESKPFAATRIPIEPKNVEEEVARFRTALKQARAEIRQLRNSIAAQVGDEYARIFDAHDMIAADPELVETVVRRIRKEGVNAEWALGETISELLARFAEFQDEYLRERREDLADVARQIEKKLIGDEQRKMADIKEGIILIAQEISPSDAIRIDRTKVIGFATETGGKTSHAVIIAKSLGIPAVIGVKGLCEAIVDNDRIVLDGDSGEIVLHPTPESLVDLERRRSARERRLDVLLKARDLPAITRDGIAVKLRANLEVPEELRDVVRYGAEGIGLYRSEFLYIQKSPRLPTEEEHLAVYRALADAVVPHTAVVRTFDLGGKKLAREVLDLREDNPVLGLRGVRLCLKRIDMFRVQLRALLRAAVRGNLSIMFPLISGVEEVRILKDLIQEISGELDREGIERAAKVPIGVMIEVPSAALTADLIAREVDFFSIGTNDLIQYALAIDRANENVSYLYQPLHPAILRLISSVIRAGHERGIRVAMCGEMASEPLFVPLLIGLGLDEFSMNPVAIPQVKQSVRQLRMDESRLLATRVLELDRAAEIEIVLQENQRELALRIADAGDSPGEER